MKKTESEVVAEKLLNLTKDSTLDLEQVGVYLARSYPSYLTKRLAYIVEVAQEEREGVNVGQFDTLF
jgi:hypothetical protein